MRAGNLRNSIEIQQLGSNTDSFGQPQDSDWALFKTVRASINPIRGNEKFLSNKDYSTTTHIIKTRYLDGLNASMRIKFGTRIFKILSTRNFMERNREHEILAEEENNGN